MKTHKVKLSKHFIDYETVIGLEVHAQLVTKSKMFCSCSVEYVDAQPNTRVCPICLGMPGVLPTINRQAVEYVVMTGLALNCTIAEYTKFDRKNYPYPDLMKGYQISQYDQPLCHNGWLTIDIGDHPKKIGITRVHLEEDTAKLIHKNEEGTEAFTRVDVNRSGVPLMEVVGEPDLRTAEEARLYLMKLRSILQYLNVSTGNMEEGSFRCDANISIRPLGFNELTTKVEIKNMNSFRGVYRALNYEFERQKTLLENGGRIVQETRGWLEESGKTVAQRSKEYAHDYRYFPEPDLPPMIINKTWSENIKNSLPELPDAKRMKFVSDYGLQPDDAAILINTKEMADFFEQCVNVSSCETTSQTQARLASIVSWLLGDLNRLLNLNKIRLSQTKITPEGISEMLNLIDDKTLSRKMAKEIFEEMFQTGKSPTRIVKEKNLSQMTNASEIGGIVTQVIATNPDAVSDLLGGKQKALTYLVGQVMKLSKGSANPTMVNNILSEQLKLK